MQARDEKLLEASLDAMFARVKELKGSLELLLFRLETEYETLNWPSFLDSFALISSQLNGLNKLLKSEKCPAFKNYILLPLLLSPDRDPELEKLTEGRVLSFNHEVVPDYLRTKPEPEVEEKQQMLLTKASQSTSDAMTKQVNSLGRVTNNIIDLVRNSRDDSDADRKSAMNQTSSVNDTNALIAATSFGKGLKQLRQPTIVPGPPIPQQRMTPPPQQPHIPMPNITMSKAQSSVKSNLKNSSSIHPYNR